MSGKIMPMELLDKELMRLINDNIDETNLKKKLNEIFISKGMYAGTVNDIFNNSNDKDAKKSINLLNYYEKLNLIKGFNEYFPSLKLKAEEYFSERIIDEWNSLERKEVEEITEIRLENMNKIDDFTFVGKISYEYAMELYQQYKLKYNLEEGLQREATYEPIGNSYVPRATLDESTVKDMKESMKKNEFESSLIILGYLLEEDKIPNIYFDGEGDIGTLSAEMLWICDGNHRIISAIRYLLEYHAENGIYPERYFPVTVAIGNNDRLKRVVKQSFLRAKEVSKEYLQAISSDDYSKFVERIISQSNVLKNNVAKTYEEMMAMNKTTTIKAIRDVIEYCNIEVNNKSVQMFKSKKISDNLDVLIDLIKESNIDLNYYNLYSVYVYFSYMMSENGNNEEYYFKLINKLEALTKADIKKLKLGNKNYDMKALIQHFDVFSEV